MQISDEMVNRADSVLSRVRGGIPDQTIRLALEAALSAAEPVRWMWEERRFAESDIWDDMYDDEKPAPHEYVRNVRPLYAAPPALTAQVQDVATPEGWQLVPKEPTRAMISAYCEKMNAFGIDMFANARVIWPAMLDAAPAKQEGSALKDEVR